METENMQKTNTEAQESRDGGNSAMIKVATFIVDRRNLFFLLFGIAIIFCVIAANWVKVEDALSAYLPGTSETRVSLELMEEEFVTYGTADIMVSNITYNEAKRIADEIEADESVAMLTFDETAKHYNNFSSLYNITFRYTEDDERALEALGRVREKFADYDIFVSTSLGNETAETIEKEMQVVSILVVIVVLSVLVFTSSTYAEVPVLLLL